MKKISLLVLMFFMALCANAGDNLQIGIYTGYNFDRHEFNDFNPDNLEDTDCWDLNGESANYQGTSFIFLSEYKYSESLSFDLRAGYFCSSPKFVQEESVAYLSLLNDEDELQPVGSHIQHTIDIDYQTTFINPNLKYFFFDGFALNCGLQMSVIQSGHKRFDFNLVRPSNVRFKRVDDPEIDLKYTNGDRTIVIEDCDLDDELKMYMALNLGISYDYNIYDNFYICPEIRYFLPLASILQGGYEISTFQAGLAVKYALF